MEIAYNLTLFYTLISLANIHGKDGKKIQGMIEAACSAFYLALAVMKILGF